MKRLAILFGSPRKTSNTRILTEEVARGVSEQEAEVEWFFLNEMQIRPCQDCGNCKAEPITRWCCHQDDMGKIFEAIDRCDGVLIASPVYFGYVTAQMKACLDRLYPLIDADFAPRPPSGKRIGFLFVQHQPDSRRFIESLKTFEYMFSLMGFEMQDHLIAADLDQGRKPMADSRPELMETALQIGRNFFE